MFGELLESNPRHQRKRGVTVVSVAVHAGLIVLGAWATAGSAPPPDEPGREVTTPVFTPPLETQQSEHAPSGPTSPTPNVPTVPTLPLIPTGPGFEIPDGLPPVDQALGDPLGDIEFLTRRAIDGIGRRGSGMQPASVLDNLLADKPALPREGNSAPAYPELLRAAGIEGMVEVEFIIDPDGRVRPGSVVIVEADHPRFAESVRQALQKSAYYAAEAGGRAVAVRVRQRFAFELDG